MTDRTATSRKIGEIKRSSYALKWYHGSDPRYCWFIRGIKPDRSFYGEITVFIGDGGKQVNVTGSLSELDYARLLSLIREIEADVSGDDSGARWEGLLAEGPATHPRTIFKYRSAANQSTAAGSRFLEMVDLLAPYLEQFYESLK